MLLYEKQNLYAEKNGPRFQKYYKSVVICVFFCENLRELCVSFFFFRKQLNG